MSLCIKVFGSGFAFGSNSPLPYRSGSLNAPIFLQSWSCSLGNQRPFQILRVVSPCAAILPYTRIRVLRSRAVEADDSSNPQFEPDDILIANGYVGGVCPELQNAATLLYGPIYSVRAVVRRAVTSADMQGDGSARVHACVHGRVDVTCWDERCCG